MTAIKRFLELNSKSPKSISVVGDSMVDEYYFIDANRISPEFPIPVFLSYDKEPNLNKPGGAANVAYQFKHFNAEAVLYSLMDNYISEVCNYYGVGIKCRSGDVPRVPIKRRLYYNGFPLCRWDIEDAVYPSTVNRGTDEVYRKFCKKQPDITILSDYNKGFFAENVGRWIDGRVTVVDPKNGPASKWKGCTIFKPNSKEAFELTGSKHIDEQLCILQKQTDAKFVIITDGGDEVYGLGPGGEFTYAPKKKVVANSVVGAGDCFVAMLALAYAHQMYVEDCVEVAFEAASVYVQKRYNEPITPYELLSHEDSISAKFIKPKDLIGRNFSLCFTNGCFDVLHQGHIELLRFAKSTADKLVVGINTDASVAKLKGKDRPINSLESRMYMLSMFEFVDFIIPFDSDTPLDLIELILPEVLCKGGDYLPESIVGADVVKDVRIFPYVEGKSTSNLIKKIRGDI